MPYVPHVSRNQCNKDTLRFNDDKNIDGLMQNCGNSGALAMELLQSRTKLLVKFLYPFHTCYNMIENKLKRL